MALEFVKKAMVERLRALRNDADQALKKMGSRRGDPDVHYGREAVNWGNLYVSGVSYVFNDGGCEGWRVVVEEASPNCDYLRKELVISLSRLGWDNVEVVTEW